MTSIPQTRKPRFREAELLVHSLEWISVLLGVELRSDDAVAYIPAASTPTRQAIPFRFQTSPLGNILNSFCRFLSPVC